ncbi:SDR family oxidoreductase [Nocardia sp. NPDC059239]|uniref:SDR family oxidoreductase n=1 Tax=unclassified Nocardia TaxID=2637762 RepID=UPI003678C01D
MKTHGTHLITGATGLVGAALALELLAVTGDEIIAVVRGADAAEATARLHCALSSAAEDFGEIDLLPDIVHRTRAVPGDILEPGCGVAAAQCGAVTHIWHSAASLRYENEHATEIHALNVAGTEHVLELARALGGVPVNYVSTSYVAGRRTGVQYETLVDTTEFANNVYEESKILAEQRVAGSGLEWRILRPSIVVGHSRTGAVTTFSGLYGFASALLKFRQGTEPALGHLMRHRRIPVRYEPETETNFVPVDLVARNGVAVGLNGEPSTVYHLANAESPTVQQVLEIAFPWAGLRVPRPVADLRELTAVDEILDHAMDFYGSYMKYGKSFDLSNTESVVGKPDTGSRMRGVQVAELLEWYRLRIAADGRTSFPGKSAFAYAEPAAARA